MMNRQENGKPVQSGIVKDVRGQVDSIDRGATSLCPRIIDQITAISMYGQVFHVNT